MSRPLLTAYPKLAQVLPFKELCTLPTPVKRLEEAGKALNLPDLYVKRDDLTAEPFGGQKVRTLEFLLGAASKNDMHVVMGLPGTSMALASTLYAKQLKLPVKTILLHTRPTEEAQRNLRYFQHLKADLLPADDLAEAEKYKSAVREKHDNVTMLNPNTPLGMLGYINAAFELKQQIDEGLLPKPDYLFVSTVLLGTATGLMLGLRAAKLHVQVCAAYINAANFADRQQVRSNMVKLFDEAVKFLREKDDTFPKLKLSPFEIMLRADKKDEAGQAVKQGQTWVPRFKNMEDIELELTWTAPTIAMLERESERGFLKGKKVLYWHTQNSRPYPQAVAEVDHKTLPEAFHSYFETDSLAVVNKPRFMP